MSAIGIGGAKPIRRVVENPDQKLREASQMYEKQFLREMVKSMRQTVSPGGLTKPTMAEKIFREKLDHQYVESWGNTGGVGLSDIIYTQIKERFMSGPQPSSPQGPIPLEKGGFIQVDESQPMLNPQRPEGAKVQKDMSFLMGLPKGHDQRGVFSPWSSVVEKSFTHKSGERTLRLRHDNGLVSTLHFLGNDKGLVVGQKLAAGEQIGQLQVGTDTLSWKLVQVENS